MKIDDLKRIIQNLENAPTILENLVEAIPQERLKEARKKGKWTIHSHACHLAIAQPMLLERFRRFMVEPKPVFIPYNPDVAFGEDALLGLDLKEQLAHLRSYRSELLAGIASAPAFFWTKEAVHPEYDLYTPYLMIRHIMMHDYLHMYRIEELWLTKAEFL